MTRDPRQDAFNLAHWESRHVDRPAGCFFYCTLTLIIAALALSVAAVCWRLA